MGIQKFIDERMIAYIRQLAVSGKSGLQIADITGVSYTSILRLNKVLDLKICFSRPHSWSAVEDQAVIVGVQAGKSWDDIAREIGRTSTAIQRRHSIRTAVPKRKADPLPPIIQYTYTTTTARICGDPPAGRDFLSRRMRGEV